MGIDKKRFRLEWISASEGAKFAEVMRDFTEDLKVLGPLPAGTHSSSPTKRG
jgi:F420-non-reducing hydrogenase iron-sulfur subunit